VRSSCWQGPPGFGRTCGRRIRVRLAHDFEPLSGHRNSRRGAACRCGNRGSLARGARGAVEFADTADDRSQFRLCLRFCSWCLCCKDGWRVRSPFFAGWGDIIAGVFAVPLLFAAADGKLTSAITAWNLFGTADLVLAIFLGVTSAEGSPLQIFTAAPGSTAMQQLRGRLSRPCSCHSGDLARHHLGSASPAHEAQP
jgi:hypothetical protein